MTYRLASITLTLIIATTAFAGCLDTGDVLDNTATAPPGARVIDFGVTDCAFTIAMVPVPSDALAPYVPEGFTPVIPDEIAAALPPDPRGDAIFGMKVLRCAEVTGLDGSLQDAPYASYWTFVDPPEALRRADVGPFHFVQWDVLVADEALRDVLVDAGLPMRGGNGHFDLLGAPESEGPFQGLIEWDNGEVYGFNGAVGDAAGAEQMTIVDFMATDGGLAEMTYTGGWDVSWAGTGYLKLDPEGWPIDVIGTERVPAYFLAGPAWSWTGTITLPESA